MASELVCLVGTLSFVPFLRPWLPLRPRLMGKGALGERFGFHWGIPSLGTVPSWVGSGDLCVVGVPGRWPSQGDTIANVPHAALLLTGAGGIPGGTRQRQEGRGTSHHEEAGQVRAGDPLSLEAEDQGELRAPPSLPIQLVHSQSAPELNGGCRGW